jgi:hypothetical protein
MVTLTDVLTMAEAICRICADPILATTMGSRGKQKATDPSP